MKKFLFLALLVPSLSFALEVDEKLTVRLIKVSESRKTLLVNRGIEDGLVEGDHAKFVVTAGIVARAVCVKVSPTRSVWAVYRLVNADFIVGDSVMSLKITPAVKITKDETQALVQEDTPTTIATGDGTPVGIPLADGAQDITASDAKMVDDDLKVLENNPVTLVERNREVYGFLNVSGLSGVSKNDVTEDEFSNSQTFYHLGLGGEYYSQRERDWYSRFSLLGEIALMKQNAQNFNGASVTNELTEFTIGTNWHPFDLPSAAGEFIPYLHLAYHIGTIKSTYEPGSENVTGDGYSANGTTSGFSIGGGYKFYSNRGFGARMLLDYYYRTEKYKEDNTNSGIIFSKTVAGPRLMMGISYRF